MAKEESTATSASKDTKQPKPVSTSATAKKNTQKNTKNTRNTRWLQIIFIILLVGIIGFGGGWLGARSQNNSAVDPVTTKQRVVLNNQGDLISAIAEEVGVSTVSVDVTTRTSGGYYYGGGGYEQQSAGTGVILTKEGLIVTNRHVVPEGTTEVRVVLSDGNEFDAEVVGRTTESDPLDIAFLEIKNLGDTELTPATLGKSSDMKVGHSVIAIGNALGQFQNTVTMGILSGYGRNIVTGDGYSRGESLEDLFQTDASINQGNSGGPLVNMNGEVIGINTAVAGGGAENIGFAIPVDNIRGLIEKIENTGKLERPYLGVVYVMVNEEIVNEYDLKVDQGAFIIPADEYGQGTVVAGSPADTAGLKEGDVIVKIDDKELTDDSSLAAVLTNYSPGDTVTLTVNRDGSTEVLEATLGSLPTN